MSGRSIPLIASGTPRLTLQLLPIEKYNSNYALVALIIAIGSLVSGLSYNDTTFQAGMFTATGLSSCALPFFFHRYRTHTSRLVQKTLNQMSSVLDPLSQKSFRNVSYLFSLFIKQGKGNRSSWDNNSTWNISLPQKIFTDLTLLIRKETPPIVDQTQPTSLLIYEPSSSDTNFYLHWRGSQVHLNITIQEP